MADKKDMHKMQSAATMMTEFTDYRGSNKRDAEAKGAIKKLLVVSILCVFFMGIEFAGGYIAHSIAIMSDAAHLLSDFSGFLISMLSILIGTRQASAGMSFGYHRAEVIGALASILLIWGLTAWIFTEAVQRVINPVSVDGKIMLITASIGLLINLIMVKVLHSGPGHHHLGGGECGHDHGPKEDHKHEGGKHDHKHAHAHAHGSNGHTHEHKDNIDKVKVRVDLEGGYQKLLSEDVGLSHEKLDNENETKDRPYSLQKRTFVSNNDEGEGDEYEEHDKNHEHHKLIIDDENEDDEHKHDEHKHDDHKHGAGCDHGTKKGHGHAHAHDHAHGEGHSDSGTEMDEHDHDHGHSSEQNINIRAAFIHIIGDIVQSIGVIIAAAIIFFKPEWEIIDPICTFLFSILVMCTTIPVTIDCIKVLMEASPKNVKVDDIVTDLMDLKGVDDVHDIHVWSLSMGKVALSAHITSDNPLATLKRATKCIRKNYKITHTTIQVEVRSNVKHSFLCSHDLH
jgi:zinc transporter 2